MKKFDKVEESRRQQVKWGWNGEKEALAIARTLGNHKGTLLLALQLTNT